MFACQLLARRCIERGHLVKCEALSYSEKPWDSSEGTRGSSRQRQSSLGTDHPIYYLKLSPNSPPLMHSQIWRLEGTMPYTWQGQNQNTEIKGSSPCSYPLGA